MIKKRREIEGLETINRTNAIGFQVWAGIEVVHCMKLMIRCIVDNLSYKEDGNV